MTPRRILITGGTSGIGLAAAMRFAAGPAHIVLNGRDAGRGEQACRTLRAQHPGVEVGFVAADVSTAVGAAGVMQQAVATMGGLEVLVTPAGGAPLPTLFHETSPEQIDGVVQSWL